MWNAPFTPDSLTQTTQVSAMQNFGTVLSAIAILVLLAGAPITFIWGGIFGGVRWFIFGVITTTLWLVLGFIIILTRDPYLYDLGWIIFLMSTLVFLGLFIWALFATLPVLLVFSIIFGRLSLIGLLGYLISVCLLGLNIIAACTTRHCCS